MRIILAALAALALSITASAASAQDAVRLSDIVRQAPPPQAELVQTTYDTGAIERAAVDATPQNEYGVPVGWDYDPYTQIDSRTCTAGGGIFAPGRRGTVWFCWFPRNPQGQLVTPWSPSVQAEEPPQRYAVGRPPEGLPSQLCEYVQQGRGCRAGVSWYRELFGSLGSSEGAYALLEVIERQYRECGGVEEPDEPEDEYNVRSRHGYSYSARVGGTRYYGSYDARRDADIETEAQRVHRLWSRPQFLEADHVCTRFLEQYEETDGFYNVIFRVN